MSYHLHIDVDIIYQWPYEKIFKWLIAISHIQEMESEKMSSMFNNFESGDEQEHITYRLKQ